MNGYKDRHGWWHHPVPEEPNKPRKCEECGSRNIDTDYFGAGYELDFSLLEAWDAVGRPMPEWMVDYTWHMCCCDECNALFPFPNAPHYYPDKLANGEMVFVHGRPMLPDEAARAEASWEREQAIKAGQMEMRL